MSIIDEQATLLQSPFHWDGREGYTPKWLIVHATSGPGAASWFQNPQANVSTNYIVEKDGSLICSVPEDSAPYANGSLEPGHAAFWDTIQCNPNFVTISIEHSKDVGNQEPLTPAQQAASFGLIKRICARWKIPMHYGNAEGGIIGHDSLDPITRQDCPGPYPFPELFTFLNSEPTASTQQEDTYVKPSITLQTPRVSDYFVASGDMWKCKYAYDRVKKAMIPSPNGALLGHGFLADYQTFGGATLCGLTDLGLILVGETSIAQNVNVIVYERAIRVYDPEKRLDNPPGSGPIYSINLTSPTGQKILKLVFLLEDSAKLDAAQQSINTLSAQVADLKKQLNLEASTQLQAENAQLKAKLAAIHEESAA